MESPTEPNPSDCASEETVMVNVSETMVESTSVEETTQDSALVVDAPSPEPTLAVDVSETTVESSPEAATVVVDVSETTVETSVSDSIVVTKTVDVEEVVPEVA